MCTVPYRPLDDVDVCRNVYHQEGVRGFYRGLSPQLMGVVPARSIHFLFYGSSKQYFTRVLPPEKQHFTPMLSSGIAGSTYSFAVMRDCLLTLSRCHCCDCHATFVVREDSIATASLCKTRNGSEMLLHTRVVKREREEIRVRQSAHYKLYKGPWDVVKRTISEEGYRALYRGLGASYLGTTSLSAHF